MNTKVRITLIGIASLLLAAVFYFWVAFGDFVWSAMTVKKVDDGLYYMEYRGDDGFEEFMKRGGASSITEVSAYISEFISHGFFNAPKVNPPLKPIACATLSVKTPEGGAMTARNFDYSYGNGLILHTIPDKGYETVTTFSTDFFGFGKGYLPEGFRNQYMALASLMLALDGINEKGLTVSVLDAGDKVVTNQKTSKPDLTTTVAVMYLLKNAADINEAISLLNKIDMHSDPGSAYHLFISDATGKGVAVEYVDNILVVTPSAFLTNHYLCKEKFRIGLNEGDHRHEKLRERYREAGGIMDNLLLTSAIKSVVQLPNEKAIIGGTLWTMIMDQTNPMVTYYSRRHFNKAFNVEFTK